MREVNRCAIVPYPAQAMFDLVADIEAYPEFLPWCEDARILEADGDSVVARLSLAQGPLRLSFTTRNTLAPPGTIALQLVDGPFTALEGQWTFTAVETAGTQLDLALQFAFSNPMKDFAMGLVFEQTCNMLVDAFVSRADKIYGESGQH